MAYTVQRNRDEKKFLEFLISSLSTYIERFQY